jgi:hypothetical protein
MKTNLEYHSDTTRISKSGLDLINKSPAHYYQRYLSGQHEEKSSKALEIGSAVHMAVLEPELFAETYAIYPELDRRTKAGKEAFEAFIEQNANKAFLSASDFQQCLALAESVKSHEKAAKLLESGKAEQTITWDDLETGAPCKARPDFVTERMGSTFIVDLKTTEDASPRAFSRSAYKYRYHVQAAFYLDGYEQAHGVTPEAFIFVAVEKTPPYLVACYVYGPEELNLARATYRANLATYLECLNSQSWPGYPALIHPLELPNY